MKASHKHLLAFAVSMVYMVATLLLVGSCYSINDDRFMGELLSGAITGNVESHLVYVNYLLSLPLSLMYRISTSVPWFGLMLLLFHLLSCFFMLDSFYCKAKSKKDILVATILVAVLFITEIYLITRISYTITASFMSVAGFVCLILHENKKLRYGYFIGLELFAFLLRDKAMLMIVPLGMAVFFGLVLIQKGETLKTKIIETLKACGLLVIILVVGFFGNLIGYQGDGWKTFEEYNDARTTLFDFSGFPPYEEVAHILDKYDVSEIDYLAYSNYSIFDYKLNLDCIKELADYTKGKEQLIPLSDMLSEYKIKTIWDPYWKTNMVMLAGYVCVILFLAIAGCFRGFIPLIFLMMARTVIWIYLLYAGRFPHRISMPLIACEVVLLGTIAYHFYCNGKKTSKWQNMCFIAIGLLFSVTGLWSGKMQLTELKQINNVQKSYMQSFYEITDYCNANPNNAYILDTLSFTDFNASVFDSSIYGKRNFVTPGTWFSNSPSMKKKMHSYLNDRENGIYFILRSEDAMNHPITQYLAKESASTPLICDTIITSHGETYSVIYLNGKLNLNMTP